MKVGTRSATVPDTLDLLQQNGLNNAKNLDRQYIGELASYRISLAEYLRYKRSMQSCFYSIKEILIEVSVLI